MLTQRQRTLLEYLLRQHHPTRCEDLAIAFKLSTKTIRLELKTIAQLAQQAQCTLSITSKVGVFIQNKHHAGWQHILAEVCFIDQNQRVLHLLLKALTQNIVAVQESAYQLGVSRQTLTRDLRVLRNTFHLTHEDLIQTTHGFKLNLAEAALRERCLGNWGSLLPSRSVYAYMLQYFNQYTTTIEKWCDALAIDLDIEFETTSRQHIIAMMTLLALRSQLHPCVTTPFKPNSIWFQRPPNLDDDACARIESLISSSRLSKGQFSIRNDVDDLAHELLIALCHSVHIELHESDPHIQSLLMHLKATCLRVKQQAWIENPLLEDVHVSFSLIYDVTQQCLQSFERKHNLSFNDHEVSYIVMHLGVLVHAAGVIDTNLKIAVVCPHGSATSRVLMNRIQSILPNHHLYGPYSVSEFEAMCSHVAFDKVITTVKLGLGDEIIVNPMLSLDDQDRIQRLVWNTTYQKQCSRILNTYRVVKQEHLSLSMLVKPTHIAFESSSVTWKTAIHLAAAPLLAEGRIKPSYVEKMIWAVDHLGPYMVILPAVAFVHAAPDDGVIRNGISCLRLKEPLRFGEKKSVEVKVIFVIASLAKEDMGLIKLIRILENDDNLHTLLHSPSIDTILAMKG